MIQRIAQDLNALKALLSVELRSLRNCQPSVLTCLFDRILIPSLPREGQLFDNIPLFANSEPCNR
ncbi:MAG TPA: hypothetical protein DGO89_09640 [Microcoleaceae bacterium UBA9251]|nr:hypothetical protein [Microcoleaceae cyanobacterium UBA9251]